MTAVVWIPEVGWESCLNGRFTTARPAGNNTELARTEIPHPAWLGLRGYGQPPLSLALSMTEKHEKADRAEIMRERGCTELEAVHIVAERIAARRGD